MTLSVSSAVGGGRGLPFRNDSGETIPAYAVVQLSGVIYVNGQHVWTAIKPSTTANIANTFFNGPTDVDAGSYGSCTADLPAWALLSDPTAQVGQTAGPEPASWKLKIGTGIYQILGLESSAAGKALVQKTNQPVSTGYGGGIGQAASFGCPPWDCNYKAGSLQTVSCTVCTSAPEYYRFWLTPDCDCCDGRISAQGWVTLQYQSGCVWESDSFDCVLTDGKVGGSCGSKIYRWDRWNSPGPPPTACGTVKWKGVMTDTVGTILYIWDLETGWEPQTYTGVCNEGTYSPPPFDGTYNGQPEYRHCGIVEWQVETSNCGCGCSESSPPAREPTEGDTETSDCVRGGDATPCPGTGEDTGYWNEIGGACSCSSASAPTFPGTYFGQTVTVPCGTVSSSGSETAKWKLTVGSTTTLQLVADDDSILLEYKMAFGRTFCCLCANAMQFTGPCGPFGCSGWPDLICLTPWRPPIPDCEDCPTQPEEYTLACSLFSTYTQPTVISPIGSNECQGGTSAQYANGSFTLSLSDTESGVLTTAPFTAFVKYTYLSPTFNITRVTGNSPSCTTSTRTGYWKLVVLCTNGQITPTLTLTGDFGTWPYNDETACYVNGMVWTPTPASGPNNLCGQHTDPWDLVVSPNGDPAGAVSCAGADNPFFLSQIGNFLTLEAV